MHTTISDRIIAKLNGDPTLLHLMGIVTLDPENPPVRWGQAIATARAPLITLKSGSPGSQPMPGADFVTTSTYPKSQESANLRLDIWVSSDGGTAVNPSYPIPQTDRDARAIRDRCDVLLVLDTANWVEGTWGWVGVSSPDPYYEVETKLWHVVRQYRFSYFMMGDYAPET